VNNGQYFVERGRSDSSALFRVPNPKFFYHNSFNSRHIGTNNRKLEVRMTLYWYYYVRKKMSIKLKNLFKINYGIASMNLTYHHPLAYDVFSQEVC
jgi:hypothetical protein